MSDSNFTVSFKVARSPGDIFKVLSNVRDWWTGVVDGPTDHLGAEFTYRSDPHHRSTHKITEYIQDKRIVWHTTDSMIAFVANNSEWTGTDVVLEIGTHEDGSEVRFTHVGLNPSVECYGACSNGWETYALKGLRRLLA
jgi:hypothetical protein